MKKRKPRSIRSYRREIKNLRKEIYILEQEVSCLTGYRQYREAFIEIIDAAMSCKNGETLNNQWVIGKMRRFLK